MSTDALNTPKSPIVSTPLAGKLMNILVSPGDVFDEIIGAPPRVANWLVPALLVGLTGAVLLGVASPAEPAASGVGHLVDAGMASAEQAQKLSEGRHLVLAFVTCLGAVAGTFWAALVLWFVGRVFLRTRFSYLKAVEVVGLAGMILALGTVVTVLLIVAFGDVGARPALSLLTLKSDSSHRLHALLEMMNFFHLWSIAILAVGLSRLSGVSFKESAFWVFGYWLLARLSLILLA